VTTKTAWVALDGDGLRFVGSVGSSHRIALDDAGGDTGPRPAELVALALAGCTAMDVISILRKKRQRITGYEVRADATQRDDPPAVFLRIDVVHEVTGENVDPEAVRRAIELSATRYCAVGATLSSGVTEITHRYTIRDDVGPERTGTVIVLGPNGGVRTVEASVAIGPSA